MSLQFVMGPSGAGKSHYLYQNIIAESEKNPGKQYIMLVPEQYMMQAKRDFVEQSPKKGMLNVEILSFGRLAYRVFEELGKGNKIVLDDVGKSMVLKKISKNREGQLKVLKNNLKQIGYIEEVKSVISEFVQYGVKEEDLQKVMTEIDENSNLYYKLHDISMIYRDFCAYLDKEYVTGEELLDLLSDMVLDSAILQDSIIVLDGFTGFTPVQKKLIQQLLAVCEKVVVSVVVDKKTNPYVYEHPYQLFALSKQTVTSLVNIAKMMHVEIEEPKTFFEVPTYRFGGNEALQFLGSNIFRYGDRQYDKEQDSVRIYGAENLKEEIDFVAQKIRYYVREKGYRYRDMAIITTDLEAYGKQIKHVFEAYDIPLFMDSKRSILLNSFVDYIRSFLQMAEQNFSYESVFRYLRTGLTAFTKDEVDLLENYVIAFGIRGQKQWMDPWTKTSQKQSKKSLEMLNKLRKRFADSVSDAMAVLKKRKKTVREVTVALHAFLCEQKLQQKIKMYEERFAKKGELALAKEYAQIYRIVIELFDEFVALLGDEYISMKEYAELLDAGLEQSKVGITPPGLDQVVVGNIERTRLPEIKALFFVGVNDAYIPGNTNAKGLISDYDREMFERYGLGLKPNAKEQIYIQKFYLYLIMTKPKNYLYLTYSNMSMERKTLRPAYVINSVKKMFPCLQEEKRIVDLMSHELTERNGIRYLIRGLQKKDGSLTEEWKELYSWYKRNHQWEKKIEQILSAAFHKKPEGALATDIAQQLYGVLLKNSVTRLEKFSRCAYAHFLEYGLRLQEREEYQFQNVDFGNIFHASLELYAKKLEHAGYKWTNVAVEEMEHFIEESVEAAVQGNAGEILFETARNSYTITRIKRMMKRTVWALTKQLESGSFEPAEYEMEFGEQKINLASGSQMLLRGKIDRVDICEKDDKVYVKIVDYKTGKKVFDISEFYYGLQMQLVTYLAVALQKEQEINPGKEIVPAGVFYYNIKDPIIAEMGSQKDAEDFRLKQLQPDGIVNQEEEVIEQFDKEFTDSSLVIPVTRKKSGEIAKRSKATAEENLYLMADYALKKAEEIGNKIIAGESDIAPYELGGEKSCAWCPYAGICRFDEKIPGYEYRSVSKLKEDEVMEEMRKVAKQWE